MRTGRITSRALEHRGRCSQEWPVRPMVIRLAGCLALAVALEGCAGPAPVPTATPSPPATPARPSATPVVATPVAAIGTVRWTTATDPVTMAPLDAVSQYTGDTPRIVAAVEAIGVPAGADITALWDYNDTSLDAFTTRMQATSTINQRWLTFTLTRDPDVPWPAGAYRISISLNGALVQQATIEVVDTT